MVGNIPALDIVVVAEDWSGRLRQRHSYYGQQIGNHIQSIKKCQPCVTLKLMSTIANVCIYNFSKKLSNYIS